MSARTTDLTADLKEALHSALDGITVNGTDVPHYEKVPKNRSMPYQVNGRISMSDRPYAPGGGYKGSQSFDVQVDTFSSYDGDKEVDAIRKRQREILMDTFSMPSGFRVTNREQLNNTVITEDNGEIRHGVIEVNLAIQLF